MMLNTLDLFSGIGGFSLGLERTGGFKTAAFCEIDRLRRRILEKHWPKVICFDDVRTLGAHWLREAGTDIVDVICGGFPCQDVSDAGLRLGIEGERSGLWSEYARLIGELRPQYVIVESVAALLGRGVGRVLSDLSALGYDAEWDAIPGSYVGSPQHRDRLWILAYPQGRAPRRQIAHYCRSEAHKRWPADASPAGGFHGLHGWGGWHSEPGGSRVAHGLSTEVDRVSALGNAVIPQIAELIGRAILAAEADRYAIPYTQRATP